MHYNTLPAAHDNIVLENAPPIPAQHFPDAQKGIMKESYTWVMVHGAGHRPEHWNPLEAKLRARGQTNFIKPDLPIGDRNASFEDDTDTVEASLGDARRIMMVVHSRGYEVLPRLLHRQPLERFVGAVIINSGGPYGMVVRGPDGTDMPRHAPGYEDCIEDIDDRMFRFKKAVAAEKLYNDIANPVLKVRAADMLRDQRKPQPNETPAPVLPTGFFARYLLGSEQYERVLNLPRAHQIALETTGHEALELPTGHTPQLSRPAMLARMCLELAVHAERVSIIELPQ